MWHVSCSDLWTNCDRTTNRRFSVRWGTRGTERWPHSLPFKIASPIPHVMSHLGRPRRPWSYSGIDPCFWIARDSIIKPELLDRKIMPTFESKAQFKWTGLKTEGNADLTHQNASKLSNKQGTWQKNCLNQYKRSNKNCFRNWASYVFTVEVGLLRSTDKPRVFFLVEKPESFCTQTKPNLPEKKE